MKIDYILTLSRLKIKNKEKKELEREFSLILRFVEKLKRVDTKDIKPLTYPTELKNIVREDEILIERPREEGQERKLLDLVPISKDRYIKVKQII